MQGLWTIYRRETAGLFLSPLAWILLTIALLAHGQVFMLYLMQTGRDLRAAMQLALAGDLFWWFMLLLPPLLTMRMISEEARSGVLEFLLTSPASDLAVILGKLGAATTFMGILWSSVLVYGGCAHALGVQPDWIPVFSGLLGATLVSGLFASVGLVASALSSTPILAAFAAVVMNFMIIMLPSLDALLRLPPGHWAKVALGHASVVSQYQSSFGIGVLDSKHLLFFLVWTAFFVFIATRLLEKRRWS
jgi:ABC-2 type transport system permease protein